jgi:arsenite methyltransferase
VLLDAFRVLKPGGRFAVADVVADGPVPDALRQNMEAWVGCIAGALEVDTYRTLLEQAGFEDIGIEITRRYSVAEAGVDTSALPAGWEEADGKIASAFVRALKPLATQQVSTVGQQLPMTNAGDCGCVSSCCGK